MTGNSRRRRSVEAAETSEDGGHRAHVSMDLARSLLWIAVAGLCALLYLFLAWQAVSLNDQMGAMEEQLARARFEHLQVRRELFDALSAANLSATDGSGVEPSISGAVLPPRVVPVPALPPPEPCILVDAGGQAMPADPHHHVVRSEEPDGTLASHRPDASW